MVCQMQIGMVIELMLRFHKLQAKKNQEGLAKKGTKNYLQTEKKTIENYPQKKLLYLEIAVIKIQKEVPVHLKADLMLQLKEKDVNSSFQ